jgi:hypothetical protein
MAHDHSSLTATQMIWQPPLIKLTLMPHKDVDKGKPSACYINPQYITVIQRMAIQHHKLNSDNKKKWPPVACTAIQTGALILYVKETTEQVAKLRDEALGHKIVPPIKLRSV